MRGRTLWYSRPLRNVPCSTSRALPLLVVIACLMWVDDFVRARHRVHFSKSPFGYRSVS